LSVCIISLIACDKAKDEEKLTGKKNEEQLMNMGSEHYDKIN